MFADHPHTDPGDGRQECDRCGKYVWPAIHSCKGVPVTDRARARHTATPCCDLHNANCEPPAELCCRQCAEAAHPEHPGGVACVLDMAIACGSPAPARRNP